MNIFSDLGSSSSFESSSFVKGKGKVQPIAYRPWSECDTLGKKVGFIFAKTLELAVRGVGKVINGAVWLCQQLTKAARVFMNTLCSIGNAVGRAVNAVAQCTLNAARAIKDSRVCQGLSNLTSKVIRNLSSCIASSLDSVSDKMQNLCSKIQGLFNSICYYVGIAARKTQDVFTSIGQSVASGAKTLADWTVVPLYNNVLTPMGRFAATSLTKCMNFGSAAFNALRNGTQKACDISTSLGQSIASGAKTLADWTVVPLYNNVLTPVGRLTSSAFTQCMSFGSKTLKTIADWTIVPLYNHVLLPTGRFVAAKLSGLCSREKAPAPETESGPKVVPCYMRALSRISRSVCDTIESAARMGSTALRTIADWTIVPAARFASNNLSKCSEVGCNAIKTVANWTIVPLLKGTWDFCETVVKTGFGVGKAEEAQELEDVAPVKATPENVQSFAFAYGFCIESTPCQHDVEITLVDKQRKTIRLYAPEILNLIDGLSHVKFNDEFYDRKHFAQESTGEVRSLQQILDQAFAA